MPVSPTALLPSDREHLAKLLGMLGSAHVGERDNAARLADRMVRQAGLTWQAVLTEAPAASPRWLARNRRCLPGTSASADCLGTPVRCWAPSLPTTFAEAGHDPPRDCQARAAREAAGMNAISKPTAHRTIEFAEDFREHIIPHLQSRIPAAARAIVQNEATYGEAFSKLWWFAWSRGASFLDDDLHYQLEDWLHGQLTGEIDRQETQTAGVFADAA
jgi:hypothetical protein